MVRKMKARTALKKIKGIVKKVHRAQKAARTAVCPRGKIWTCRCGCMTKK